MFSHRSSLASKLQQNASKFLASRKRSAIAVARLSTNNIPMIPKELPPRLASPTNAKVVELPPEVIDAIIDYLHDDKYALLTCALVSPKWIPRSRYHFLYELTLEPEDALAFCSLSQDLYSTIPRFVRSLTLKDGILTLYWSSSALSHLAHCKFTSLEDLCIDRAWFDLDESAITSMCHGFASIKTLKLHDVSFTSIAHLAQLVCSLPLLESLSLRANLEDETATCPPSYCLPESLNTLTMRWSNACIVDWLVSERSIHGLRRVYLDFAYPALIPGAATLLRAVGSSLQQLSLVMPKTGPTFTDTEIDLTYNTRLRALTLSLTLIDSRKRSHAQYWLPHFLAHSLSRRTEVLTLRVRCESAADFDDYWPDLREVLANPTLVRLRAVQFVVCGPSEIEPRVRASLPQCDAKGLLRVQCVSAAAEASYQ
ncbi:hypothetical protein Hypma_003689 [Hypsizygus marmoreus]|uniref:F-box domain-containing protein n=1 Tax=Hypsizygus marmoreus TaxID=39966 RepID=A0A369J5Z2_HYPMA|nr:hypothetical protein Hypma_003689 [Hypsizygus marmoreus]